MKSVRRLLCSSLPAAGGPAWGMIQEANFDGALQELNRRKARHHHTAPIEGVDFLRAICFLNKEDPLHARQALLEELRWYPGNSEARDLLNRLHDKLGPMLALPGPIAEKEPLFAMFYDGIRDHTMLDWIRLLSLFMGARKMCEEKILGDFVECGVAGGGASILLALTAAHYSAAPRRVFACDTFTGMPQPTEKDVKADSKVHADETHWSTGTCSGSEAHVLKLAKLFSVDVTIVKGDFVETLGTLPTSQIALLHTDSDWYASTLATFDLLFDRMVRPGGLIQVDDYGYWGGCRSAVDEFLSRRGVPRSQLVSIGSNAAVISM